MERHLAEPVTTRFFASGAAPRGVVSGSPWSPSPFSASSAGLFLRLSRSSSSACCDSRPGVAAQLKGNAGWDLFLRRRDSRCDAPFTQLGSSLLPIAAASAASFTSQGHKTRRAPRSSTAGARLRTRASSAGLRRIPTASALRSTHLRAKNGARWAGSPAPTSRWRPPTEKHPTRSATASSSARLSENPGLHNGSVGIVRGIDDATLQIQRRDSVVVPVDTREHPGVQHGYCSTEYREQGATRYAELQLVTEHVN